MRELLFLLGEDIFRFFPKKDPVLLSWKTGEVEGEEVGGEVPKAGS